MGKPAARISDMHTCPMVTGLVPHVGGPVAGPGVPTVLIGGMPAAVVGDMCVCVGPPDTIAMGSSGVMIGGKPAARMGDQTAHGGVIVLGCPTVLIGETDSVQVKICPCVDAKVEEMPHIEKMWTALNDSHAGTEVMNELGGPVGIATKIGTAFATGAVATVVTDAIVVAALAFPVSALVIGGVALIAAATVGRSAVEDFAGKVVGDIKGCVEEVKKGADHLADFYEETKAATTCQQLKDSAKSFDEGVKILGPQLINATIDIAGGIGGAKAASGVVGKVMGGVAVAEVTTLEQESLQFYKNIAKTGDFSTTKDAAVFYSGPGSRDLATEFLKNNPSKVTIEMTKTGNFLDNAKLYDKFAGKDADEVWKIASESYAKGASGDLNAFVKTAKPDRVYHLVERPILSSNSNVNLIEH